MLRAGAAASQIQILAKSAVAVSSPADTTEDVLATITIPGGSIGLNGRVRISTRWSMTNNVNSKSMFVRFNGAAGTQYLSSAVSSVAAASFVTDISNRNSASSQVGGSHGIAGNASQGSATITSAVNTAADVSLVISGTKTVAGDTLTLESYMVEIIPG